MNGKKKQADNRTILQSGLLSTVNCIINGPLCIKNFSLTLLAILQICEERFKIEETYIWSYRQGFHYKQHRGDIEFSIFKDRQFQGHVFYLLWYRSKRTCFMIWYLFSFEIIFYHFSVFSFLSVWFLKMYSTHKCESAQFFP